MKIGIPNNFCYAGMEKVFVQAISELFGQCEIVFSGKTTMEMVEYGLKNGCDELCIPAKIFIGHVEYLVKKMNIEVLFLPRLISLLPGTYSCPKIISMPDIIKANYQDIQIIIPEINFRKKKRVVPEKNKKSAYLFDILPDKIAKSKNLVVLAHSYVILDEFLNKGILSIIRNAGYNPLFPVYYHLDSFYNSSTDLPKELFWSSAREIYSFFEWAAGNIRIEGVIYLMTFGCGIDSVLQELVMKKCIKHGLPYLCITIDEHCTDVGIQTRIEAYLDMIEWRKDKNEKNYLSTHG